MLLIKINIKASRTYTFCNYSFIYNYKNKYACNKEMHEENRGAKKTRIKKNLQEKNIRKRRKQSYKEKTRYRIKETTG